MKRLSKLSRIAIVLLIASLSANTAAAAKTKAKVLILGGGVAGLQAAYTLKQRNIDDIILLEADSRLGGRLLSANVPGIPSDSTYWPGDSAHEDRDTLLRMVNLCKVPVQAAALSSTVYVDEDGNDVTQKADARRADLRQATAALSSDWKAELLTEKDVLSVEAGLRLHGWHPKTAIDTAIEHWFFEGILPYEESLTYYLSRADYAANLVYRYPAGEAFTSNLFVDCMRDLTFNSNDERLQLGVRVTGISYDSTAVRVFTAGGVTYEADYVIVTFSLGVLQQDEVTFTPPLTYQKRVALNEFGLIPNAYVYAILNGSATFNGKQYAHYVFAMESRLEWHWCRHLVHAVGDNDIFRFWLSGEESRRIERQPVEDTMREVSEVLRSFTGKAPVSVSVTNVTYNPLYYGGYRLWPPGADHSQFDVLRAPILNRVFFAGDGYDLAKYAKASANSGNETGHIVADCIAGACSSYAKFGPETQENTEMPMPTCEALNVLKTSLSVGALLSVISVTFVF